MKIQQAITLLQSLEDSAVEEVRVVVEVPTNVKIGDFLPSLRSRGFMTMLQRSALADAEILVTGCRS